MDLIYRNLALLVFVYGLFRCQRVSMQLVLLNGDPSLYADATFSKLDVLVICKVLSVRVSSIFVRTASSKAACLDGLIHASLYLRASRGYKPFSLALESQGFQVMVLA
jgi:hypothetical protein